MVDATRVFEPGYQVTNAAGTLQSGAVLRFYDAGTSNTRTVYSDTGLSTSLGVTVTTNSAGRPAASGGSGAETLIYTGTTAYKVTAETSIGVALWTFDNVIGALDTSSFLTGTVIAEFPVTSKTANYTILDADEGKIFNGNPTGGSFTFTLPSAVTVGNGWPVTIRHVGTANSLIISPVSAQTIDGHATLTLTSRYETMTLVSDGANWHLKDWTQQSTDQILILPRGYIDGCKISNGSDATNDINIAAGVCRDITNTVNIVVPATTGKQLDANWAAGGSAGMRNSAAGIANGTYHIIAARTAASSTADFYAFPGVSGTDPDTTAAMATMLAAIQVETGGSLYVYGRRIASIVRASASILAFSQTSDLFQWSTIKADVSAATLTATASLHVLTVPLGLKALAHFNYGFSDSDGDSGLITSPNVTDEAVSGTANANLTASVGPRYNGAMTRETNTAGQIRARATGSSSLYVNTTGYSDTRGKDS